MGRTEIAGWETAILFETPLTAPSTLYTAGASERERNKNKLGKPKAKQKSETYVL